MSQHTPKFQEEYSAKLPALALPCNEAPVEIDTESQLGLF